MRYVTLFLITVLLAGCSFGRDMHYREGATLEQLDGDEAQCKATALRDAPVAMVEENQTIYDNVWRCYKGNPEKCGYVSEAVGTKIVEVDANEDLRRRIERQCLGDQGYRRVYIRDCPRKYRDVVPVRPTRVLPELTENSCVIRYNDDTYQIVNKG